MPPIIPFIKQVIWSQTNSLCTPRDYWKERRAAADSSWRGKKTGQAEISEESERNVRLWEVKTERKLYIYWDEYTVRSGYECRENFEMSAISSVSSPQAFIHDCFASLCFAFHFFVCIPSAPYLASLIALIPCGGDLEWKGEAQMVPMSSIALWRNSCC